MPPRVESAGHGYPQMRLRGTARLLAWLESYPGCGWQERWANAGADLGTAWMRQVTAGDTRTPGHSREEVC
jgi:hypothetical protein